MFEYYIHLFHYNSVDQLNILSLQILCKSNTNFKSIVLLLTYEIIMHFFVNIVLG